jgi:phosphoglycolate phosphatase-like HAD superfamily hydrolase
VRSNPGIPDPAGSSGVAPRPDPAAPSTVLLFDLDGTITDSFAGIERSFRHALATVGAPEPDPAVVAGIAGPPMVDSLRALDLDESTVDTAMRAYRERYVRTGWLENSVFDGMAELLSDLSTSGRRLAVATSKNQTTARQILEHFGLADHFDYIAGASDDGTRRSKSDVIGHALASLGIDDPADHSVVMIGDRSHDVHGSAEFGIPAVFVRWGYAVDDENTDAAWTVDSVPALRELLHG